MPNFVQAGVETSDTGSEAVKPDPGRGVGVGDENAECCGVVRPFRIPLVILPVARRYVGCCQILISFCAVGTIGCLDFRRRASTLDGQVSAEWNRCSGSIARRARNSVTPLRRSPAGWMPARMGRLSSGVGRRHPVTIRKASLMAGLIRRV